MRIIKEGKIPIDEKQLTCSYCETVFGYEPQDCKEIIQVNKWNMVYQGKVYCPLCFNMIVVRVDEVSVMRYRMAEKRFS